MVLKDFFRLITISAIGITLLTEPAFAEQRGNGDLQFSCFKIGQDGYRGYWSFTPNSKVTLYGIRFEISGGGEIESHLRPFPQGTTRTERDQTRLTYPQGTKLRLSGTTLTNQGLTAIGTLTAKCR